MSATQRFALLASRWDHYAENHPLAPRPDGLLAPTGLAHNIPLARAVTRIGLCWRCGGCFGPATPTDNAAIAWCDVTPAPGRRPCDC